MAKRKAARKGKTKKGKKRAAAARRESAKRKFERGLVARGEVAPAGAPLPPGATHEIVRTTAKGRPVLKRRRFSLR